MQILNFDFVHSQVYKSLHITFTEPGWTEGVNQGLKLSHTGEV